MAGQGVGRREVLRMLAMAAGVAAFPGFSKWSIACGHVGSKTTNIKPTVYRSICFSAPEYAFIECLTGIIIPADETPGAHEAGVSEFIDVMASRDPQLQHDLRNGLVWLDTHSQHQHGGRFVELIPARQIALLEPLAYSAKFRKEEEKGQEFFERIREYTLMGFYTSKVGLRQLDFPGLKFYASSPSCPHHDDPSHLHLPPPQ